MTTSSMPRRIRSAGVLAAVAAAGMAAGSALALGQGPPAPDIPAGVAAILEADVAFNKAVAARSRERFLALIHENAVFNGGTPDEARGHEAILRGWAPFFDKDGPTLTWHPTRGEVLVGGDIGVTIGSWVRRGRSAEGTPTEARGQYVTTWAKGADGAWKVVFDIGSTAP